MGRRRRVEEGEEREDRFDDIWFVFTNLPSFIS